KGDHVLWILGTVSPLPKRMIWQSDAVQTVLQETQEVVPGWPAFGIGANPFTALRLYIQWRRIQKPPDHMKLPRSARTAVGGALPAASCDSEAPGSHEAAGSAPPTAVRALLGPQVPIRAER